MDKNHQIANIAVYCTKEHPKYKESVELADYLSAQLLESAEEQQTQYDCVMAWYHSLNTADYYLSILDPSNKNQPYIYIDYINNLIAGKSCYKCTYQDPIPKAMGLAKLKNAPLEILDGTAGLTIDSYSLLQLHDNITITLIEQSAIIYSLIKDAIGRLKHSSNPHWQKLAGRLQVFNTDCISYLQNSAVGAKFDIIYLDPMFEKYSGKVKAKPKKNMQLLQQICSNPINTEDLLNKALPFATNRLILKRGKDQPKLLAKSINYSVTTKQLRYDVYLGPLRETTD